MNIKMLIDKVSDNWIAKLVCFVAAVLVFVFHKISLLESMSFVVPLNVVSQGLVYPTTDLPEMVKINVKANSENLASIGANGVSASIDLTNITEAGWYKVPVKLKLADALMLIDPLEITVSPEFLDIYVDERIERYVPLSPALTGEPEFGYTVKNIEVSPSSIKVVGPASVVNKMTHIYTGKIIVKGAAKGFSTATVLDNIYYNVELPEVPEIKVTVDIQPVPSTKNLQSVSMEAQNLDPSFILENSLQSVSVNLSGTLPVLNSLSESSVKAIVDCSSVNDEGEWTLPVTLQVPSNVEVQSKSVEKVTFFVKRKSEIDGSDGSQVMENR